MAQVPLGRAGIGHALQTDVFGLQGSHQLEAALAHLRVARLQLLPHAAAANLGLIQA